MTDSLVPAQLEMALDELDMAQQTLDIALHNAHLSAIHSTYTAALKRILAFNTQTIKSVRNLLRTLKRQPSPTEP